MDASRLSIHPFEVAPKRIRFLFYIGTKMQIVEDASEFCDCGFKLGAARPSLVHQIREHWRGIAKGSERCLIQPFDHQFRFMSGHQSICLVYANCF
jgi:hypothetical protein